MTIYNTNPRYESKRSFECYVTTQFMVGVTWQKARLLSGWMSYIGVNIGPFGVIVSWPARKATP